MYITNVEAQRSWPLDDLTQYGQIGENAPMCNAKTGQVDIVLVTANARFHHASLALRYLMANLGDLEDRARILETNGYAMPESQSPWQQYFREKVGPFDKGMILKDADNYQDIARKFMPRDNH